MNETVTVRIQKIKKNTVKARLIVFLILVAVLLLVTIFADKLAPYDPYAQGTPDTSGSIYLQDALSLMGQAQAMLDTLDPNSPQAVALQNAIWNLNSLISSGSYSQGEILGAMGQLTQAMAGIY